MTNIPLKTITFPGLPNKYTVPEISNDLMTAGKAADAKATGDALSALEDAVTEETDKLKADLETLANVTPIPDNSDLNNYGETGLYSIEYGNYTILHYPMDTIVSSYLEVRKMTTGYVGQKLTMPGSGKVFTRSRYSNGNWNNWIQIPTLDTTLSQSGVPADAKAVGDELSDIKADLNEILEQGILSHFAVDNDGYVCQKVEVE